MQRTARFVSMVSEKVCTHSYCRIGRLTGEDETQDTGKDVQANIHVVLHSADSTRNNDSDDDTSTPQPTRNLLLRRRKILDMIFCLRLGGLFLQESRGLAALSKEVVKASHGVRVHRLERVPNGLILDEQLGHGSADHDHDARPEEPVARRWRAFTDVAQGCE